MRKIFNAFTTCYIVAAILIAHQSLVAFETSSSGNTNEGAVLSPTEQVVCNSQRLGKSNKETNRNSADYRIEKWGSWWCADCKKWNREELPSLLKVGYQTTTHDVDRETAPTKFRHHPHIIIYYKDKIVHEGGYMTAKEIITVINGFN